MIAVVVIGLLAADFSARVLDQKTGELRFLLRHEEQATDGRLLVKDAYLYPTLEAAQADGLRDRVAVVEEAILQDGKLLLYTLEQRQRNQHGVIEVEGTTLHYTWTSEGQRRTKDAKLTELPAVPSSAGSVLAAVWPALAAGSTATARLAVVSVLDDFGFELKPERGDPGEVRVRVKPSNTLVALFAPELYFRFSPGGRMRCYHGPLNVAKRDGKDWSALFADLCVEP